jgi:hypoxanthine phosphoribosyltransferase
MRTYSEKIIINEKQIKKRVRELGEQIYADFAGTEMVVIGILKGSFIFLADLTRWLYQYNLNPQIDFTILSSYGASTRPTTMVKIERDVSIDIQGKAVLVVDDILDSGRTMYYLKERLSWMAPEKLKICVFLDKPARHLVEIKPDYVGYTVDANFVVGYGLDYNGYFRERPYIAALLDV